ncbi:MAG TPA: DUF983 domain-containing protein [Thermoanaerobaculia bacterium]|nr:DUF983 domain-containing protein [Thermoanaerobaculia bacterium]
MKTRQRVPKFVVLRRGWRRRCPRCGEGALFLRWIKPHERCPACGVIYLRNYGDIWMFVIITDRIPIFFGIVALYFGFRSTNWIYATLFFIALFVPMIATMRERQGLAIACDYLWRIYMPDPSDEIHDGRDYVVNV